MTEPGIGVVLAQAAAEIQAVEIARPDSGCRNEPKEAGNAAPKRVAYRLVDRGVSTRTQLKEFGASGEAKWQ